uniref:Flavin reductase family protein n=1 Tax=candidate division WOR-3 bacterium TaxID=2052148 RepID=A0A7C4Y6J9_UNCW3
MLKEIKKYPYRVLHPKLVALISSMDEKDIPNVCTVAWIMPVSIEPPLITVALQKKHKTTDNILKRKEFVVNIPVEKQVELVKNCGSCSGWKVDKFKDFKIEKEEAKKIKTPRIKGCAGYIECELYSYFEAGDHYLFNGKILISEADDNFFGDMWNNPPILYHFGKDVYGKVSKI